MFFSNEQAFEILEAMVSAGAEDFETGATKYIEGLKAERKGRQALNRAISQIANAREVKNEALRYLIPEMKFFTGGEFIKPPLNDPDLVLGTLFNGILDRYDETVANLLVDYMSKKPSEKEDGKNKEEKTEAI